MRLKERIVEGKVELCKRCGYKHAFMYHLVRDEDDVEGNEVCGDCMLEYLTQDGFTIMKIGRMKHGEKGFEQIPEKMDRQGDRDEKASESDLQGGLD